MKYKIFVRHIHPIWVAMSDFMRHIYKLCEILNQNKINDTIKI